MTEKCYECGTPCATGETYCLRCQAEDELTVQLTVFPTEQAGY